ncbi:MAG TPA: pantoate--beta-alanine ligase [Hanamia sp.]|nr:pantoate--beta-alanine ligase [Hanamia sp.]
MIIFKTVRGISDYLKKHNFPERYVGFVPTMGALHEGHLSLINESRKIARFTVCSIFVNPTQFNNPEDLKKYPKTIENDILLLEQNGCNVLFMPDEKEIYPDKKLKKEHYELGYFETILEGKYRPGHFQGVCQVVERLLNIIKPDFLILGQKDFQQCLVIKRLLELKHKKIELIICPVLREKSGLAMSSRNLRLNSDERKTASGLNRVLLAIKNRLTKNNFSELRHHAIHQLEKAGFRVEYLELAKRNDLEIITQFKREEELIILVAAFLNEVRLIDNVLIKG